MCPLHHHISEPYGRWHAAIYKSHKEAHVEPPQWHRQLGLIANVKLQKILWIIGESVRKITRKLPENFEILDIVL